MTTLTIEKPLNLKKTNFSDVNELLSYFIENKIFADDLVEFGLVKNDEISAEDLRMAAEILETDKSKLLNLA